MTNVELPFKAEYAKSGRSMCKGCKSNIPKGALRIAAMVQSAFHDGKQANWYDDECFFEKQRPMSVGDIDNYENLRVEDQKKIEKVLKTATSMVEPSTSKKNVKKRGSTVDNNIALKDFGVEYSKTNRATCRGCELKIAKGEIRIKKVVYDTEVGMKYGGQPLWHHMGCFAQLRNELGWLDTGANLPGFGTLTDNDQEELKKLMPALKVDNGPNSKKMKMEKIDKAEEKAEKEIMEKMETQMKLYHWFRDNVKEKLSKLERETLLTHNNQQPVEGDSEKLLDQIADLLCFGAIEKCTKCSNGQFLFTKSGYTCNGDLTQWTKCINVVKEPKRKPCEVPTDLIKSYPFLKKVKKQVETRIVRYIPPSKSTIIRSLNMKKNDEVDGPKVKRERPPLYQLKFGYIGLKNKEEDLKMRIAKLGGECTRNINEKTIAIFATPEDVKNLSGRMLKARDEGLNVIPVDYIDAVEKNPSGAISYITSMTLCDWGTDPAARIPREEGSKSKSKSIYEKSVPKSMTLKVKDGMAVDPASGLEDTAHVYVSSSKERYNAVLGCTDIQSNKNSYYKIQLLESDDKRKYHVFRSWGRIGTTIGKTKLEKFAKLLDAIESFEAVYLDKTGNDFKNRHAFVKNAGKMYPIDVDYGIDDSKIDLMAEHHVKSKLPKSVQEIIKLIFNVENMKRTMLEFDLDMEKMPLGKLSKTQIQSAYGVLTEIHELIKENGQKEQFIDATNRFYTLIPHNFGTRSPPILDTAEEALQLQQMLDNLLEIECAYNLIKTEGSVESDVNPLDAHYDQLKTTLEPLDRKTDEFNLIQKYVKNTHAETHSMYELEIVDIFKVVRQGEARRYKPFKKLHNRRLLWHGSRLTNFAGILSQGLKIAPPEAPVTGYMFGKGIYFADMVSKAANYCCTTIQNSTGLMLLSEVALGDMMECTTANYITKLPKKMHSCYGRGSTMPDPKKSYLRNDGVEIPLGTPIKDEKLKSSLLYNEFIVYDVAQVNIQYLLRMNFKYKF